MIILQICSTVLRSPPKPANSKKGAFDYSNLSNMHADSNLLCKDWQLKSLWCGGVKCYQSAVIIILWLSSSIRVTVDTLFLAISFVN